MSQITITGRRWARSRMTSISPLVGHAIELLVDDLLDARPHVGDAAGGEGLGDQAAQPRMVGRILHQHGAGEAGDGRLVHAVGVAVAALHVAHEILAEALVAQGESHVLVARDQPEALRRLEDGRRLAQAAIERIGVGDEGRIERIELERRAVHHGRGHVVHGHFLSTNPLAVRTSGPSTSPRTLPVTMTEPLPADREENCFKPRRRCSSIVPCLH